MSESTMPKGYRAEGVTEDGIRYISVCRWDQKYTAWRMVFSVEVLIGESDASAKRRAIALINKPISEKVVACAAYILNHADLTADQMDALTSITTETVVR